MKKQIFTSKAPEPIGPFSQAIQTKGTMLFVSGHVGAKDGTIVSGGIKAQARQTLENIQVVLEEAGYSFANIVKANIYLMDMDDFKDMNDIYAEYLPDPKPARTAVQVARLPMDAQVEMEMIATKDED